MLIARRVEFVEVFDINMDVYATVREDLDFCTRLMMDADPVLTQQIKCGVEVARKGIHLKSRTLDCIGNAIYPVPKEFLTDRNDIPKSKVEEPNETTTA